MAVSVYSRTVQRATELLGGRDRLARRLRVPKADIDRWIADEAKPPRDIFLRIVDLILDDTGPAHDADADPPPSRDAAGANKHFES